jgi:hypothetical protein
MSGHYRGIFPFLDVRSQASGHDSSKSGFSLEVGRAKKDLRDALEEHCGNLFPQRQSPGPHLCHEQSGLGHDHGRAIDRVILDGDQRFIRLLE